MKTSAFAAALAMCLGIAAAGAAHAQVTERDTTYQLDTSGGLSNTVTRYDNKFKLPAGGASTSASISLKTGFYDLSFGAAGGVTTDFVVPPPGTPTVNGNIFNDGTGGGFSFGYTTNNGPDLNASWTENETLSGFNVLHFAGGGFGLLNLGGVFVDNIFISGDWSTAGLATGGHTGLTFDPGFTVINDFVYDPGTNQTLLTLSTGTFNGTPPNINFFLVGAPTGGGVPEPAAWALMLAGFAGVGAALRARRRAAALA